MAPGTRHRRVIDESGEDYLYETSRFAEIQAGEG
jgi:hypothetical protein